MKRLRRSRLRISVVSTILSFLLAAPVSVAAASETSVALHVNAHAFSGHGDLAFVSLGDLYVLDGASRHLANVTGDDEASDPEFSPNGEWLTYETNQGASSWLARADGLGARRLPGSASWLPSGQLAVSGTSSTTIFTVGTKGTLHRDWQGAGVEAVRAGRSTVYLFVTDSMNVDPRRSSRGVVRVETSASLVGRRTLWYEAPVSFTPQGGLQGRFVGNVSVLPNGRGLLLTISNYCCDYADGQNLYELRAPLGQPKILSAVLTGSAKPSYGPNGTFAFEGGGDRYAWVSKHVKDCVEATAECTDIATPPGELSLAPAWSPNARTLAFIEASAEPGGMIGQRQISQWYATHHLYLWRSGSTSASEVAGTEGAAAPLWSADSRSLLYVDGDALHLIVHAGAAAVEIAGPLFPPDEWSAYYGEINWASQFAWSKA